MCRPSLLVLAMILLFAACSGDDSAPESATSTAAPSVEGHEVFGVRVGSDGASDDDVALVATLVGDTLDRSGDGRIDSAIVGTSLEEAGASILVVEGEGFSAESDPDTATLIIGQPNMVDRLTVLQAIHGHLYRYGWAEGFDEEFGMRKGSELAFAMDHARGGSFDAVPTEYPGGAWFTQSEPTCDYDCQLTEYFFHVHMALLGRYEETAVCRAIADVWQLCTAEAVAARDPIADDAFRAHSAALVDLTA